MNERIRTTDLERVLPFALFAVLACGIILYLFQPLFAHDILVPVGGEFNLVEKIQTESRISFQHWQLPLWNPFFGPGGSHTTLLAFIPWDYHFAVSYWIAQKAYLIFLDFFLIFVSFFLGLRLLRLRGAVHLWLSAVAVLYYVDLDFIRYFIGYFYQNAIYIAVPVAFSAIYSFERRFISTTTMALTLSFSFIFASEGSKIEVWLFQMPISCFLWMISCRLAQGQPWLLNTKNRAYAFSVLIFLLGCSWKIYLLTSQIVESERVHAASGLSVSNILIELLNSFRTSTSIQLAAVVFGFSALINSPIRKWPLPTFISICSLAALALNRNALSEDFGWAFPLFETKIFIGLVLFLAWAIGLKIKGKPPWSKSGLLALLVWALLALLMEDTTKWNWGNPSFGQLSGFLQILFLIGVLGAVFSPRRKLLCVCVIYLGIYTMMRNHFSLIPLRALGVIWHTQRDSSFFLFPFCLLFILGWEFLLRLIAISLPAHAQVKVWLPQFVALGFLIVALPEARVLLFSDGWSHGSTLVEDPSLEFPTGSRVFGSYVESMRIWAPMSGVGRRLREASIYGSTISKFQRRGVRGEIASNADQERCNLNYLWFPNNLQRVFACSRVDRLNSYLKSIAPDLDLENTEVLSRLALDYLIDDRLLNSRHLKLLQPRGVVNSSDIKARYVYEVIGLDNYSFINRVDDETADQRLPLGYSTDLYFDPALKDHFEVDFELPMPGKVFLRQTYSRLWKFTLNGKPIEVSPDPYGYVTFFAPEKRNKLQAIYAPELRVLIAGSVLIIACLVGSGMMMLFWRRRASRCAI